MVGDAVPVQIGQGVVGQTVAVEVQADRAITSGENGVTGYVDTDGDGRWDVKLTDADGDGAADAAGALTPKP